METIKPSERKPIAPTLKKLSIGGKTTFPVCKYSTVNATIQRLKTELKVCFTIKKDALKSIVTVTRVA